jgi:hypothetical protein
MGSGDYLVHLRCAVGSERGRFLQSALPGHDREGDNFARLVALEFDPESGDISVLGGAAVHAAGYPALETILEKIGRACVADGIALHQLRRITFLEDQVILEGVSRTGEWELRTYPTEERPH